MASETYFPPPVKESVCQQAHFLVHVGGRQLDYGHPLDAFEVVASFWTVLLSATGKLVEGKVITAEEVVQCLQLLKIQREANRPKEDNRVDLAGYAEVLDLIVQERVKRGEV